MVLNLCFNFIFAFIFSFLFQFRFWNYIHILYIILNSVYSVVYKRIWSPRFISMVSRDGEVPKTPAILIFVTSASSCSYNLSVISKTHTRLTYQRMLPIQLWLRLWNALQREVYSIVPAYYIHLSYR